MGDMVCLLCAADAPDPARTNVTPAVAITPTSRMRTTLRLRVIGHSFHSCRRCRSTSRTRKINAPGAARDGSPQERALERGARDRLAELDDEPDPVAVAQDLGLDDWVAVDDDEIGELSLLDRPELGGEPECIGGAAGSGSARLAR